MNNKIFSKSVVISLIFLFFSILILFYVFYRSEIFYQGDKKEYYLKYYYIGIAFLVISGLSFFIKNINLKINFSIFIISTFIALFIVELFLSFYLQNKQFNKVNTKSLYSEYLEKKEVYENLVLRISPSGLLNDKDIKIFPLSGISNEMTLNCNENGYYTIYKADRYGFNNPDYVWSLSKLDYVLIGDSFTHGDCVNQEDNISGRLKKNNNKKNNVLNLGQAGTGPLIQFSILKEYLPLLKTKRLIWLYYENDLVELKNEFKNEILKNYFYNKNFTQNLIKNNNAKDNLLFKRNLRYLNNIKIKDKSKINTLDINKYNKISFIDLVKLKNIRLNLLKKNEIYSGYNIDFKYLNEFEQILTKTKKLLNTHDIKLYFVFLPQFERYANKTKRLENFSYSDDIIKIVKNLNIPIINADKKIFQPHHDPISLFPNRKKNHYTVEGYRLVSELIFNYILEFEK